MSNESPSVQYKTFDATQSPVDEDGEKIREVIDILGQDRGGEFNGRAVCARMILESLLFWFAYDPEDGEE